MKKAKSLEEHNLLNIFEDLEYIENGSSPNFRDPDWKENLTAEQIMEMPSHWRWGLKTSEERYVKAGHGEEFRNPFGESVWNKDEELESLSIRNESFFAYIYPDRVEYTEITEYDTFWDRGSRDLAHYLEEMYPIGYKPTRDRNDILVRLETEFAESSPGLYGRLRKLFGDHLV